MHATYEYTEKKTQHAEPKRKLRSQMNLIKISVIKNEKEKLFAKVMFKEIKWYKRNYSPPRVQNFSHIKENLETSTLTL